MFGNHKGYDVHNVTKYMLQKENFGAGLSAVIDGEALCQQALKALADKGRVYLFTRKRKAVYCVIFTREENGPHGTTLRNAALYALPEVEHLLPEFRKTIMVELQEAVAYKMDGIECVIWDEAMLTRDDKRAVNHGPLIGLLIGAGMAAIYGMLFKNIGIGLCFGVSFGLMMSMAFSKNHVRTESIKEKEHAAD